jgi:hypothetical protein
VQVVVGGSSDQSLTIKLKTQSVDSLCVKQHRLVRPSSYGRGGGVKRGLGVGATLGVGEGLGVGVGV